MPDVKPEPYPETYRVPSIWFGTLPCSPNSLPMARRFPLLEQPTCGPKWSSLIRFSCPGWNSSRQHCGRGPCSFFWFSSMISLTLKNPLYLFADDSTLCHTICHPSDRQAAASSLSADLDKITSWSNTWNIFFNPDKSHSMSFRKDCLEPPPHLLSQQST